MSGHVLIARLDNAGDVLLAGPAIRAVATRAGRVTALVGPRGLEAAALLPGVDAITVYRAPWIDPQPEPVDADETRVFVDRLAGLAIDQAFIFTSFHQSALPLALLLRLAGVPTVAAISEDYPGALLDVRHRVTDDCHEVERTLSLVATLGYRLPDGDDGRLRVRRRGIRRPRLAAWARAVVVHPGASVPARAWDAGRNAELVDALVAAGYRVVVTGGPGERALTARVAGRPRHQVCDLGGRLSLAELADLLADACALIAGNTGPAHLASAVGTPVVSLFAPTVPAIRWRPWRVDHRLLGDQAITCAGCRSRVCPIPGRPCLAGIRVADVLDALSSLLAERPPANHAPCSATA